MYTKKWGKWTREWRTGEGSLHLGALCWWAGYAEIFCMFKMTLPWVSALKSRIKPSWVANSALGDLPGGALQGEAGRKQRVIPQLFQWLWNQTSMSKPEWMQQCYFMPHIQRLFLLSVLMVQAFNPRNSSDNVDCASREGESRYTDIRLFLQESLLSFYALHKFTDTPATDFQSAILFFFFLQRSV